MEYLNLLTFFDAFGPIAAGIFYLLCINYIAETLNDANIYFLDELRLTTVKTTYSPKRTFRYDGSGYKTSGSAIQAEWGSESINQDSFNIEHEERKEQNWNN